MDKLIDKEFLAKIDAQLSAPLPTHNQEDLGDSFTLLVDKLVEMRMETAKQLLTMAENNLHKVEQECNQLKLDAKRKWEEYQRMLGMLQEAGSATADIGRKISNGFSK